MEELFARKRPRSRVRILGASAFALLGGASLLDAVRDAPLVLGGRAIEPLAERLGYRLGAALFCLAIAALLFPSRKSAPGEREGL